MPRGSHRALNHISCRDPSTGISNEPAGSLAVRAEGNRDTEVDGKQPVRKGRTVVTDELRPAASSGGLSMSFTEPAGDGGSLNLG